MMRIGVLGPLEVRVGSMSRALGSEKQRLLLAALTVHAGSVVSTDRLVEILWGEDPPPSALRSLRTYIYRLR
ncbi:MAG: winged helix-turn-helix domain-containing protein, partial [Acidimicrobiales bacterium]